MSPSELGTYVRMRCVEDEGGCLIWKGALNNNGQPVFNLRCCGTRDVRRVMWKAAGRKIIPGYVFAKALCDDRCVLPAHQRHVSRAEAMQQASADGRLSTGALHSMRVTENSRKRKHVRLTMDIARQMRARYAETGNAALVAREFGVSHSHAHRVVRGEWWREVNPFAGLMR